MKKMTTFAAAVLLLSGLFTGCSDDPGPARMNFVDAGNTMQFSIFENLSFEFTFLTYPGLPATQAGTRVTGRVNTNATWTDNPITGGTQGMASPGNQALTGILRVIEVDIELIYTVNDDGDITAVEVMFPNASDPNAFYDNMSAALMAGTFHRR